MVLSFMDLLGVNLDVLRFGPEDRVSATIALIKAYIARRNMAILLYIAPTIATALELSMLLEVSAIHESSGVFINMLEWKILAFTVLSLKQSWE
ncbi:uncharacterized protein H6S33_007257 [Morchella sextelata]|uniref:uncharacterized protein n=1 Tax=Morchella sextelata TaxID=1174677 RepID=UPI001D041EEB|nr:uncharacterized protein H6S33_007257 [Morchella sextelata]KAH0603598.1 hypothetical protein H6S33_007257 [Morchella sextelata]